MLKNKRIVSDFLDTKYCQAGLKTLVKMYNVIAITKLI